MGFPSKAANRRLSSRKIFALLFVISGAFVLTPRDANADQIVNITGGDNIWAWDTNTNTVSSVDNAGVGLDSLMFDAQGNIVYDSYGSSVVGRFNVTTLANTSVTGIFSGPADMALEPGGTSALISNANGTTISRVNLSTSAAIGSLSVGARPDGVTYDNAGHLFAVLGLNRVAQIDPITGAILNSISTPNQPDGLTFDATTGKLYVASDGGGFYTLPTDLSSATFTSVPGMVFDGIASSGNDLFFVIRNTGGLLFDLTSMSTVETSPFIAGADDIAPVAGLGAPPPVPEPITISLFGAGLAGLVAVRRRKAKRVTRIARDADTAP
jgi:hypothetical protein